MTAVGQTSPVAQNRVQTFLRNRSRKNDQWRREVQAQHLDSVNRLANISDAELIATAPGIPNVSHQMEMDRRLKVATAELTAETIAARESSERVGRRVILLTAVLVVLTIVLAVRS